MDKLLLDELRECLWVELLRCRIESRRNLCLGLESFAGVDELLAPPGELLRASLDGSQNQVIGRALAVRVSLGGTTDVLAVFLDCG